MKENEFWELELEKIWASLDTIPNEEFLERIFNHINKLDSTTQSAIIAFEKACAYDSTGNEIKAEPLYRQAIKEGLQGLRRRRANIQLASTLRNNGKIEESILILRSEKMNYTDELDDAVNAFLALSLSSQNKYEEALSITIKSLSKYLPRYRKSVFNYANELETQKGV